MKKFIYNARKAFNEINEMVTVDPLVALCQTVKLRENIPTSALEELEDIADMEYRDNFYNDLSNTYNKLKEKSGEEFTSYINTIGKYEALKEKIDEEYSLNKIEEKFGAKEMILIKEVRLEKKKINDEIAKLSNHIKKIKKDILIKILISSTLSFVFYIAYVIFLNDNTNYTAEKIYIVSLLPAIAVAFIIILFYLIKYIIFGSKYLRATRKLLELQQEKTILFDIIDKKYEEKIIELEEERKQEIKHKEKSFPEEFNVFSKIHSELKFFYDKHNELDTFYKLPDAPLIEDIQSKLKKSNFRKFSLPSHTVLKKELVFNKLY